MLVHANDNIQDLGFLDGRSNDDAFGTTVQVSPQGLLRKELASTLEDNIDAEVPPGDSCGIRVTGKRDARSTYRDIATLDGDRVTPSPLDAVEFQQMCSRRNTTLDFVDVNDLEPVVTARVIRRSQGASHRSPQRKPPDTPHSVNAKPHDATAS
jgi:hypothetical protein